MKKEIKKERLPDLFGGLVDAQHYSEYYAKTLKKCLKDYVIPFMEKKGYMYYNLEIGEEFFSAYSQRNKHFAITSRRTVLLLRFYLEEKEYMRQPYKTDYQFPGQIGVLSQQFIEHYCKVNRSSDKTRRIFVQVLSRFSNAMEIRGITLEMLSHEAVMDYISSLQNTRRYVYSPLRRYLLYLYQNGYTTPNLALSLAGLSEKKGNSLPSVYYSDEIKRIELSVKRDSPVGKRDYAILLLADRLGLRRGDIRNLTMANIDWEKCIISFCQQKTGKYNELPLLEDVGLAILDYFLHGRTNDIAAMDSPKAIGQRVGRVKEIGNRWLSVAGLTNFANGDGLCFFDGQRQLVGFRVNRVEGNKLFPLQMPKGLRRGMELYRNFDKAFVSAIEKSNSSVRKMEVRFRLTRESDTLSLEMSMPETELRLSVSSSAELTKANKPQHDMMVAQLSKLGNTPFVADSVDVDEVGRNAAGDVRSCAEETGRTDGAEALRTSCFAR